MEGYNEFEVAINPRVFYECIENTEKLYIAIKEYKGEYGVLVRGRQSGFAIPIVRNKGLTLEGSISRVVNFLQEYEFKSIKKKGEIIGEFKKISLPTLF